jgi:hypothetical protein
MLPASGPIKLKGISGDTNAVSIEIYGTPTNLNLKQTYVYNLFGIVVGSQINLLNAYNHCWSNCACNVYCVCDADCGCDINCTCDACPSPDVLVFMADGSEKCAGDLVVGDMVLAWDEAAKIYIPKKVLVAKPAQNFRLSIALSNGQKGMFAANHRFLMLDGTWKELQHIRAGEIFSTGVSVVETLLVGIGPVVSLVIEDLHTYLSIGIVSHNAKNCPTYNVP